MHHNWFAIMVSTMHSFTVSREFIIQQSKLQVDEAEVAAGIMLLLERAALGQDPLKKSIFKMEPISQTDKEWRRVVDKDMKKTRVEWHAQRTAKSWE